MNIDETLSELVGAPSGWLYLWREHAGAAAPLVGDVADVLAAALVKSAGHGPVVAVGLAHSGTAHRFDGTTFPVHICYGMAGDGARAVVVDDTGVTEVPDPPGGVPELFRAVLDNSTPTAWSRDDD